MPFSVHRIRPRTTKSVKPEAKTIIAERITSDRSISLAVQLARIRSGREDEDGRGLAESRDEGGRRSAGGDERGGRREERKESWQSLTSASRRRGALARLASKTKRYARFQRFRTLWGRKRATHRDGIPERLMELGPNSGPNFRTTPNAGIRD
jgi:hypothetical protein